MPSTSRVRRLGAGLLATAALAAGAVAVQLSTAPVAHAATTVSDLSCDTGARMFQIRNNGSELWYASVGNLTASAPTFYRWRKIYDFSSTRPGLAVAAHQVAEDKITLFVTDPDGGLRSYRYYIDSGELRDPVNLLLGSATSPGPYAFSRLTSDGRKLYGVKDGYLHVMTSPTRTAAPRGRAQVEYIGTVRSFWGNATYDQEVGFTDSSGRLRYLNVYSDSSGWHTYNAVVRSSGWDQRTITSPGGGMLIRGVTSELWRHIVTMPTTGTSTDITVHDKISDDDQLDVPVSTLPTACAVNSNPGGSANITYDQLYAMFGSRVYSRSVVEPALPSLIEEMDRGNITTAARKAAFLATLVNESRVYYGADQTGATLYYHGRGYIQLTGESNYRDAGSYFNINLTGNPDLARTLSWSDKIARWYWTKRRPATNDYADKHDMGGVNAQIAFAGYNDPSSSEVQERCADFKRAYHVLAGSYPSDVECV